MIGLSYILFVKEMPLKELAEVCFVSPQLVASWRTGTRKIPEAQLTKMATYLKVEPDLIAKELTFEDKMKIEMQLNLPGAVHQDTLAIAELYQRHEALKQRYATLFQLHQTVDAVTKTL